MNHRIFFYSHDTMGLGHIRRTQKIANYISGPERSILIACASPVASSFLSEPGIEYINLPGFTKLVSGEYAPRNLNVSIREFVGLRSALLLAALAHYLPDLIIIDKEPMGVKQELRAGLQYMREIHPECKIICGFRDILDDTVVTKQEWEEKNTIENLRTFYDKIFVYGEKEIFNFVEEYNLPSDLAAKLEYVGYINPEENKEPGIPKLQFEKDLPLLTVTLGGGGDGDFFLKTFLEIAEQKIFQDKYNILLLTGPFIPREILNRAKKLENEITNFRAIRFTSNTRAIFAISTLVITMGGYNSLTELVSMGKYPLVIPRVAPRVEQLIRAKVFRNLGLCDYLDPREISVALLSTKISEMMNKMLAAKANGIATTTTSAVAPAIIQAAAKFSANGLERIATSVQRILYAGT